MRETGYDRMKRLEFESKRDTLKKLQRLSENYYNDPDHIGREAYLLAMQLAIDEIDGWEKLMTKAHAVTPYANPKEAEREHGNTMRLLAVIKSKLTKKLAITPPAPGDGGEG